LRLLGISSHTLVLSLVYVRLSHELLNTIQYLKYCTSSESRKNRRSHMQLIAESSRKHRSSGAYMHSALHWWHRTATIELSKLLSTRHGAAYSNVVVDYANQTRVIWRQCRRIDRVCFHMPKLSNIRPQWFRFLLLLGSLFNVPMLFIPNKQDLSYR